MIPEPVQNLEKGFYVIQPGSSVPMSLCERESTEKHVKVYEKKMKIKILNLKQQDLCFWDVDVGGGYNEKEKKYEEIKEHLRLLVEEMIVET